MKLNAVSKLHIHVLHFNDCSRLINTRKILHTQCKILVKLASLNMHCKQRGKIKVKTYNLLIIAV